MRYGPPVRFARRRDGHNLAYQVLGDADLDLVFLLGHATHLGLPWEDPGSSYQQQLLPPLDRGAT